MESVGRASPRGARGLLAVPGPGPPDADDEDGELVVGGIRPKSSPLPRRRSSASDDDSEPEAPASGSRRVSFADAKGLSLVHVKEFEMWEVPNLPRHELCEGEGRDADQYSLSFLNFSLPSDGELLIKVQDHKVVLESLELLPATTILRGVVRVLNVSFSKAVFVRTSLDAWCSHFDLLAEYTPGSSDGHMDRFSFRLTLVPPCGEQGTRVDLCLRYETPAGTFWANNDGGNYVLLCHREMREKRRENVNKRSCLKPVSQNLTEENCSAAEASSQGNVSPGESFLLL
ncbi:protein phosphatase 1 regulatory subunit 3A-like isoform X2 [Betta splendens]|nr:protein phosphatase 1 regulatory subunit 3A-like isoform X2 [Betta splendens]